jgi:uncharacterized membrane protein
MKKALQNKKKLPNCRVILTLLILVAGESFAGTMTALPGIPGANEIAWDINDTGVVVGTAYFPGGAALPVRWTGGAIELLDGPLGNEHCPIFFGDARSVTGAGTVVARIIAACDDGSQRARAATWNDDDDVWEPLPTPAGADTWSPTSNANGDNAYQVFDYSQPPYFVVYDGVTPGPVTQIPGTESCTIYAINNYGLATGFCGEQAMAWFNGDSIVLDGKNGEYSYGRGLNDLGTIVGVTSIDTVGRDVLHSRSRALVWDSLGDSKPRVLRNGWATDVNNNGDIVGVAGIVNSQVAQNMRFEAVMWTGNKPVYLGTLGGPASIARAINESGAIVGQSDTDILVGIEIYEQDAFIYVP